MSIRTHIRRILVWVLLTEAMLIISTRLGAFLHEFVGHGLAALLFGGRFEGFSLTLFAGGHARFTGEFGDIAQLLVSLGGIVLNMATGLAVLLFVRKHRPSFSFTLFGMVFAGASVLSQLQYLVLGSYYGHGDPVCLTPYPAALWLAWAGGVPALALFCLHLMRFFFRFQDAYFPVSSLFARALVSLLILGIPIALYAGLYHWLETPLVSTAAIEEARSRIYEEAERIKTETGSDKSIPEIAETLTPHPILPWIVAAYLVATLIAFFCPARAVKEKTPPLFPSSARLLLRWITTAGGFLLLISLIW